jgi:glycosyltransferase involved in cell wall biosynthesis
MRVVNAASVSNQPEGGVANVAYNSASELRKRGHEVTCLFREDVMSRSVAMPRFGAVYFACRLAGNLRKRKDEFDVANIHAPVGFAYGLLRRLSSTSGLPPSVMMLHGIEERRNHTMAREAKKRRAWHFRWKNRVWQRIYHIPLYRGSIVTADQAVVINQRTWTMLQLKYDREIGQVWYVPNTVEPQYFTAREYSNATVSRLLFVGSWLDHKGVYYLRDGFEELVKRVQGMRLRAGCSSNLTSAHTPKIVSGRFKLKSWCHTSCSPRRNKPWPSPLRWRRAFVSSKMICGFRLGVTLGRNTTGNSGNPICWRSDMA